MLFVATGVGNGATYRMIPAVFRVGATTPERAARSRKAAAGCIGIAGAVGAFGGFLIPRGFAVSNELAGSLQPALCVSSAVYLRHGRDHVGGLPAAGCRDERRGDLSAHA